MISNVNRMGLRIRHRVFTAMVGVVATWCLGVECVALQSGSRGFDDVAPSTIPQNAQSVLQVPVPELAPPQSTFVPQLETTPSVNTVPFAAAGPVQAGNSSGQRTIPGIPAAQLVDPIFEIHDSASIYSVDHSSFDYFLSRYLTTDVQGINRICYVSVTSDDHQILQGYLQQLQSTDVRVLNRNEQLAYWFNLYNAKVIALVIKNYPVRSVRQIKQNLTDFVGPFDDKGVVTVLGRSLSLNDIESGIIRPIWRDPRIHYALNCASFGCPNLSATAWTSHDLETRLNQAAYEFINSGRAVKRGILGVRASKIYKWYASDFGGQQGVLNHLRQFANCDTLKRIGKHKRIASYFYDWSLNDGKIQRRRIFEPFVR